MKIKMHYFKLVAINYAVFVTILITFELVGQLGFRIIKGRFLFDPFPNVMFEEHPYLVGTSKKNFQYFNADSLAISTDSHGFRITREGEYLENAINVVCLGGSTTFGTMVPDSDSWPYKLQTKLGANYNVFNLGVPGYTTLEAIIQLSTIVPELKPNIIIVYEGWNDIRNYHTKPKSPSYYWHGMQQKHNLQVEAPDLWDYFFILKFCQKLGLTFNDSPFGELHAVNTNDPYIDSLYVRNLRTIKVLCDNMKAKSIFIPQVLNVDSLAHSDGVFPWTPNIASKQLPLMMNGFNLLMEKAVHPDANTVVVNDVLRRYNWSKDHFGDFGHFNKEGGDLFVKMVVESINKLE
jgi:hypothetical protein